MPLSDDDYPCATGPRTPLGLPALVLEDVQRAFEKGLDLIHPSASGDRRRIVWFPLTNVFVVEDNAVEVWRGQDRATMLAVFNSIHPHSRPKSSSRGPLSI